MAEKCIVCGLSMQDCIKNDEKLIPDHVTNKPYFINKYKLLYVSKRYIKAFAYTKAHDKYMYKSFGNSVINLDFYTRTLSLPLCVWTNVDKQDRCRIYQSCKAGVMCYNLDDLEDLLSEEYLEMLRILSIELIKPDDEFLSDL